MARKIRIEYAGAAYHVMARCNQGRDIYADDRDRKLWLERAVPAHHGAAAVGERAVGDGVRIAGDAGHRAREARAAAGTGAAEEATGAGLRRQ